MSAGAKNPDVRWKQRLQSFRKALGQLRNAVLTSKQRELSELERQGVIQAFEFTHELAWNTLKDYLEDRGEIGIHGSKDATRRAFKVSLIPDDDLWMEMIQSRNRSTHTYNENTAKEIAALIIGSYFTAFEQFENRFSALANNSP